MVIRRVLGMFAATASATFAVGGLAACSADFANAKNDPNRVDVVAAFYPLQYVAERIGGDAVRVVNLAKPGAEPHDLELNPGQVGQVSKAEVIIYLKGFQPAVDEAIEENGGDRAFDVATVQPLADAAGGNHAGEPENGWRRSSHAKDPHVWLDPTRLATIADRFADRLIKLDPGRAAEYTSGARALRADLTTLDHEFEQGLLNCQRRELVTSHTAFGYLADRYRLEQVGVSGLTPEDEPSPRRLADVTKEAREHGATTIFFETLVSPKVADTIAREINAHTAVLDPLEGIQAGNGADYLSVMRTNLNALQTALSCT